MNTILSKNEKLSIAINGLILLFLLNAGIFFFLLFFLGFFMFILFGLFIGRMYFDFLLENDRFNYVGFFDYCSERPKGSISRRFDIWGGIVLMVFLSILIVEYSEKINWSLN